MQNHSPPILPSGKINTHSIGNRARISINRPPILACPCRIRFPAPRQAASRFVVGNRTTISHPSDGSSIGILGYSI